MIGRKAGNTISIPVCFVLEYETLYLLPVQGSGDAVVQKRGDETDD
ncbi:MAG: hypothetical protein WB762_13535 [Candidatus Sulfotelmatobacter sp.]